MAVNVNTSNLINSERWLGIKITGRTGDGMAWIAATDIILVEQDEISNTNTNIYYKSGTDTSTVQLTHAADASKVVSGEIMEAMWKLNAREDIVKEEVILSKAVSAVKTGCSICAKTRVRQAISTGPIDPTIPLALLNVTGTKAYTLADSTEVGATVQIIVTAAESTPAGTLTPETTSGNRGDFLGNVSHSSHNWRPDDSGQGSIGRYGNVAEFGGSVGDEIEMSEEELSINRPKAYKQFMDLYNFMAGQSLVHLLPSEGNFQDLVYVANLGLHLHHICKENHILLSNYTSPPRQGEEYVGEKFFNQMGYKTHISPYKWEGEADIKYLKDNVYIGGYGIRSDIKTYEWMEENFDMKIIKVKMTDEYMYHLDCSIFPLNNNKSMVCTELYDKEELVNISRYTDIVDINVDDSTYGMANSVRLGNMILCASNISELKRTDEFLSTLANDPFGSWMDTLTELIIVGLVIVKSTSLLVPK